MNRTQPEQVIAHVDLLRAVDRLLEDAETVRAKRLVLNNLVADQTEQHPEKISKTSKQEAHHANA